MLLGANPLPRQLVPPFAFETDLDQPSRFVSFSLGVRTRRIKQSILKT